MTAVFLDAFGVAQLGLTLGTGSWPGEEVELEAGDALDWLEADAVAYCLARR